MEFSDIEEADDASVSSVGEALESPNSLGNVEEKESSIYSQQKLGACILHLYTSNMSTDITFRCKDHDEDDNADRIHAHKIVLAARSPLFKGMFFGPCAENSEGVDDLLTTEAEILDLVLRYIYSDETNLTEDTAVRVLELAHMYQIPNLVEYCADFLTTVIVEENACDMLELALLYNQTKLRDDACSFIDNHAEQVLHSDGFLRISNDCLTYILKGNTLFGKERYIFERVMYWAERKLSRTGKTINGQNKRNVLGEAFCQLRLPTLNTLSFVRSTKDHDLYTMKEMLNIIEYINDNSFHESICHSSVTRMQEIIQKHIPPVTQSTVTTYGYGSFVKILPQAIDCTVLVTVSNDCSLCGLSLQEIYPYLPVKNEKCISYEKDRLVDVTLDCVLCLDEIKYKAEFQIKQNESEPIILENPVFLGRKDTPYTLKLEMKYRSENSSIYLEAATRSRPVSSPCTDDTNHTATCLTMHQETRVTCGLSVSYCNTSKHFNCIDNWIVQHISGRNSAS